MAETTRHICGISGGKDSSALAVYLRYKVPDMEYFFCDTGAELPETYEYLTRLEVILGKPIVRLNATRGFDHWFEVFRGALPSPQMRWCTKNMKIKPIEEWIGETPAISYVANPGGRVKPQGVHLHQTQYRNPVPVHRRQHRPRWRHANPRRRRNRATGLLRMANPLWLLLLLLPAQGEWIGLSERHPELFERAVAIEQKVLQDAGADGDADFGDRAMRGRQYTWSGGETLLELRSRRDEILERHEAAKVRVKKTRANVPLIESLSEALDEDDDTQPCTVCAL